MHNKTDAAATEALSLAFLGLFLLGSVALFGYQILHYTTLLG